MDKYNLLENYQRLLDECKDSDWKYVNRPYLTNIRERIVLTLDNCDKLQAKTEEEKKSKDNAYSERNKLVQFLSLLYPAHMKRHPEDDTDWEDDWRNIVCIHSPMGQLTWHIHDSEASMFSHLNRAPDPFADCEWDGHTTEEKYSRLLKVNCAKSEE